MTIPETSPKSSSQRPAAISKWMSMILKLAEFSIILIEITAEPSIMMNFYWVLEAQ